MGNVDDHEQVETLEVRVDQEAQNTERHMTDEGDDFRLEENRPEYTDQDEIDDGIGVLIRIFLLESVHLIDPHNSVIGDEPADSHETRDHNQGDGTDDHSVLQITIVYVELEILEPDFLEVDQVYKQGQEPTEDLDESEPFVSRNF
jgi:hypothetical protein